MNSKLNFETLQRVFLLLCTLVLTKAFTWIYTGQGAYILDAATSQVMRIHSAIGMLMIAGLLLFNWRTLLFSPAARFILIVFAYFLGTAFWASEGKESVRMSLSILFQILIGLGIVYRADFHLMLERLTFMSKAILVVNLIFFAGFYSLAIEPGYFAGSYSGAWRGIYSSKNAFGAIVAFCHACILLNMLLNDSARKKIDTMWLVLAFFMLVMSMSATSIITAIGTTSLAVVTSARWFVRSERKTRVNLLLLFFLIGCLMVLTIEALLGLLGRDLTFTGRTILWVFSFEHIEMKPWLGYGLNSFWREMLQLDALVAHGLWNIGQAHNGFIDALLAGGIVGGALTIAIYGKMLLSILNNATKARISQALPVLLVFFWLSLVQNLTETSFPYGNRITGIIITLFFIVLHANQRQKNADFEKIEPSVT